MDRKELIREYKEAPRPAGVYRITHTKTGRSVVGHSTDAPSMLNRHRAQLRMGSHPNSELQTDWDADGGDAFIFEVLDTLEPRDGLGYEPDEDLRELEELWLERLALPPESTY